MPMKAFCGGQRRKRTKMGKRRMRRGGGGTYADADAAVVFFDFGGGEGW
jgi:hypothetical protein